LKLNGKDDRLRRADFKAFASTAGLKAADADTSIDDLVAALSRALNHLELPPPLSDGSQGAKMAEQMRAIVHERIEGFA
ncbi:MAG: type II toxin-antitoxin system HipA family toxin, partial [Mesorhizobium sp.]